MCGGRTSVVKKASAREQSSLATRLEERGLHMRELNGFIPWQSPHPKPPYGTGFTPSMGFTCRCVREPGSRTLPILVGCIVFSTTSKKQYTPLQSCGTQLRAFFTVRKQHTIQVKPVEGFTPL